MACYRYTMFTTLLLVALASPLPDIEGPPLPPGEWRWEWDGIHPRTLHSVPAGQQAELATAAAEAASAEAVELVDCWALAWELPAQPASAFGAAKRW